MDVLILGAGGHGRVVLDILRTAGVHRVVGFIDSNATLHGATVDGVKVLGAANTLTRLRSQRVASAAVVAIGDNRARVAAAEAVQAGGFELVNVVHPRAIVSPAATLGVNVVVCPAAVIGPAASVGDHVIVNTAAVVEHECVIETGVHLAPGVMLAGRVTVRAKAFVGLGARVIQCLTIGEEAVVGAGTVVIRDVPVGAKVVGVPARVLNP